MQHVPASGIYPIVHLYQVFHGNDAVQLHCQRCPVGSVCATSMSWTPLQSLADVLYGRNRHPCWQLQSTVS